MKRHENAVARLIADRERQGLPAAPSPATVAAVATVLRPRSTP